MYGVPKNKSAQTFNYIPHTFIRLIPFPFHCCFPTRSHSFHLNFHLVTICGILCHCWPFAMFTAFWNAVFDGIAYHWLGFTRTTSRRLIDLFVADDKSLLSIIIFMPYAFLEIKWKFSNEMRNNKNKYLEHLSSKNKQTMTKDTGKQTQT